eukprot:TRINITY_DN9517_c0_g1_i1.p1 TRINITY_DN9517_c0_g1~~TRINITY_DN9517_c0_g1_i1.p1  ORF type:complete len:560 (+),score=120.97 TRINITY_DN9517_c0_g1_i1:125-1804(+)
MLSLVRRVILARPPLPSIPSCPSVYLSCRYVSKETKYAPRRQTRTSDRGERPRQQRTPPPRSKPPQRVSAMDQAYFPPFLDKTLPETHRPAPEVLQSRDKTQEMKRVTVLLRQSSTTLEAAERAVSAAREKGIINIQIYSAYIHLLGSHRLFDDVQKAYNRMRHTDGIQPDAKLHSIMAALYLKDGRLAAAESMLGDMKKAGHKPEKKLYAAFIDAYGRSQKLYEMKNIINEMKVNNVALDVGVYNSIINAYAGSTFIEKARSLVEEMRSNNVAPDVITYSTLIHHISKAGDLKGALELMQTMKNEGLKPDAYTYTHLIQAFLRYEGPEYALRIFSSMKEEGAAPTLVTYTQLAHGLVRAERPYQATQIVRSMHDDLTVMPSLDTYNDVLSDMCDSNAPPKFLEDVITLMRTPRPAREGIANPYPDASGDLEEYVQGQELVFPDVQSYSFLIRSYVGMSMPVEAMEALARMRRDGLTPNLFCYQPVVDALCRANRASDAMLLIESAAGSGVPLDARIGRPVLEALVQAGYRARATLLLSTLKRAGVEMHQDVVNRVLGK